MAWHCMWSRIRLTCIADNAKTVISLRSFFLVFYSVQYTHTFWIAHIIACSLFVRKILSAVAAFVLCGCGFASFIFQSHFELFTTFSWRLAVENAHIGFKPKEQPTVRPIHTLDSYKYPMNYFDGIKRRIFFFFFASVCNFLCWFYCYRCFFGWSRSIFHRWSNASHSSAEYEPICRRVCLFFSIFIITLSESRALLVDSQQISLWRSIVWSSRDDRRHLYSTLIPCHLPTKSSTLNTFVSCIYMMKKMIFFLSNSPESAVLLHYNFEWMLFMAIQK